MRRTVIFKLLWDIGSRYKYESGHWILPQKEMYTVCVLCFTPEERDSGNEEENEASETILGEGMQVYME